MCKVWRGDPPQVSRAQEAKARPGLTDWSASAHPLQQDEAPSGPIPGFAAACRGRRVQTAGRGLQGGPHPNWLGEPGWLCVSTSIPQRRRSPEKRGLLSESGLGSCGKGSLLASSPALEAPPPRQEKFSTDLSHLPLQPGSLHPSPLTAAQGGMSPLVPGSKGKRGQLPSGSDPLRPHPSPAQAGQSSAMRCSPRGKRNHFPCHTAARPCPAQDFGKGPGEARAGAGLPREECPGDPSKPQHAWLLAAPTPSSGGWKAGRKQQVGKVKTWDE